MIMMCQCRFISCKKRTTVVGDGCACVRVRGIWEISVMSSQFGYEPKTALFKKSRKNKCVVLCSRTVFCLFHSEKKHSSHRKPELGGWAWGLEKKLHGLDFG